MPWETPSPENRFSPLAPTTHRDLYFESVCNVTSALVNEGYLTGLMVWAWSGEGRPSDLGPRRLGDPPHETPGEGGKVTWADSEELNAVALVLHRSVFSALRCPVLAGWYSVFDSDRSTIDVLTNCFWKLRKDASNSMAVKLLA